MSPSTQISVHGIHPKSIVSVRVSGAKSGLHEGELRSYSDNSGASYLLHKGLIPNEHVSVSVAYKGKKRTQTAETDFTVAQMIKPSFSPAPSKLKSRLRFVSDPNVRPAAIRTRIFKRPSDGNIFLTPGNGQLLIVNWNGDPIYYAPGPKGDRVSDFKVQRYLGAPVLTWWHGPLRTGGLGEGAHEILDQAYRHIAEVKAGNGYRADLHDLIITGRRALVPVASVCKTPSDRHEVVNSIVQEIDIPTGLVMFEWHALGHIDLNESFQPPRRNGPLWDAYHINSVEPAPDGDLVLSFRHTSAVYKISRRSGEIKWRLGGRRSSFKLEGGLRLGLQHDARFVNNRPDLISLFNNQPGSSKDGSRAQIIKLDYKHRTASVVNQYHVQGREFSESQGSMQILANGNIFVGGGWQPWFAEFTRKGQVVGLGDVRADSYRAYLAKWVGRPGGPPSVAIKADSSKVRVYVSWNGATEVQRWRVLWGDQPDQLNPVKVAEKRGFETVLSVPPGRKYYAVEALSTSGTVLGTSPNVNL